MPNFVTRRSLKILYGFMNYRCDCSRCTTVCCNSENSAVGHNNGITKATRKQGKFDNWV